MQGLEDSIRGYRVQYNTIPSGAEVICDEERIGVTPFFKYRDLTLEQKQSKTLNIGNCRALWQSGAEAKVGSTIPLDIFPNYVEVITERPSDAPGIEGDERFGAKILAERQKIIDDFAAQTVGMFNLMSNIREASKINKRMQPSASIQTPNQNHLASSRSSGIGWNWVSSGQQNFVQPSFSRATITPVFRASSCMGSIVEGRCIGQIAAGDLPSYCAGSMIAGKCIGSMLMK
jgi:hypothetical protein